MSLAAIGTVDLNWQDKGSSALPVRSRGLRFPMAVSFAAHLGLALYLLSAMAPDEAASMGDPNAIEVTIVRIQKTTRAAAPARPEAAPQAERHEAAKPEPPKQEPAKSRQTIARAEPVEKSKPAAVPRPAEPPKPAVAESASLAGANSSSPVSSPLPSPATNVSFSGPAHGATASATPRPGSADSDNHIFVTEARYRVPPTPAAYPKRARDLNQQGEALIRVRLDDEGNAEEVLLWKSSGFVLLDNAALAAARRWQFQPARRNGMPVIAWVQIPVRFSLN